MSRAQQSGLHLHGAAEHQSTTMNYRYKMTAIIMLCCMLSRDKVEEPDPCVQPFDIPQHGTAPTVLAKRDFL